MRQQKKHRGLLVDVARHYLPLSLLKRTAASLGAAKMNVMHLHLTDSQSFPVLLSSIPQLATLGAFDFPAQVYTPADLRELVQYAKLFGVRIIPEIDIPAHTLSWGKAFPEIIVHCSNVGTQASSASDVPLLDPSKPHTFAVVRKVLTEIASIFPDELLHLGSDEVHFKCWLNNERIRKWGTDAFGVIGTGRIDIPLADPQKRHYKQGQEQRRLSTVLQSILIAPLRAFFSFSRRKQIDHKNRRKMSHHTAESRRKLLASHTISSDSIAQKMLGHILWHLTNFVSKELGKIVVVWQEALAAPTGALPNNTVIQVWRCWGNENERGASTALRLGLKVLDSKCWYLDWPSHYQKYYSKTLLQRWSEFDGGEAALWTEHIDASNFECKVWPRTAFVAQILWHGDAISGPNMTEAKRLVMAFSMHLSDTTGIRPARFDDITGASGVESKAMCSSIDQVKSPRKPPTPPSRLAFAVCDSASKLLDPHPTISQFQDDLYLVGAFVRFLDPNRAPTIITAAAHNGFPFVLHIQHRSSAIISTAPIITLDNYTYNTGSLFLRLAPQSEHVNLKTLHHHYPVLRIHDEEDIKPLGSAVKWANTSLIHLPQCHLFVWHPDPKGAGEPFGFTKLSFFQVNDNITTFPRRLLTSSVIQQGDAPFKRKDG
mmetsp:Transcript_19434/g.24012  ORF Transcript_19434/g.24012 Transcript_19434/m.24012 type:complete len:657 (+) Transcript_19434:88-2058(+)